MIQINNKEVSSVTIGGKDVQKITIGGKTAYEIDYFNIENTILIPATGTEYSVTANVDWSPNIIWTSATINISNTDQGAGNRNAYLTFTPSEVVNGVLTPANNIDIYFQDPDTWFELIVYNNGTVVDTQTNIPYTVQ